MRRILPLLLVGIVYIQPAVDALEVTQFRQIVALGDDLVGELLGDSAAWLPDGRGLVVGGWERWPHAPAILVAPDSGSAIRLSAPAAPGFAVSPAGDQIAYWSATGGGWCQLALVNLSGEGRRYVGDPLRIGPGMQLAWPSPYTLIALLQDGANCTAFAINIATGTRRPMVQIQGGQWVRLRQWPGWDPVAVWAGDAKKCFRLTLAGTPEEVSADFDDERPTPDASLFSFFDADSALWLGGLPSQAPVRLSAGVGAACWSPDGSLLSYATGNGLWCAWPPTLEKRKVLRTALDASAADSAPPLGMTWAPDGGAIAYWRAQGQSGQVRRVRLGLEEVTIRVRYPRDTRPQPGQQIWVASKLQFDAAGRVKEPVWQTLKGQFVARRVLPGAGDVVVEAVSVGTQAGILGRIVQQGIAATEHEPRADLVPGKGLFAWVQGTQWAGELVGVEVRRAALGATGGPASR